MNLHPEPPEHDVRIQSFFFNAVNTPELVVHFARQVDAAGRGAVVAKHDAQTADLTPTAELGQNLYFIFGWGSHCPLQ